MTAQLFDLELERRALGACILKPALLLELELTEDDFSSQAHKYTWQALQWLQAEGHGVDSVRLYERLSETKRLEAVGGNEYLLSLTDTIPEALPPTRRLRDLTRLRTLEESAKRLLRECATGDLSKAVAAAAETQLWATEAVDTQVVTALDCAITVIEELRGESKRVLRVNPGLEMFADAVGDLAVGSLTVIGAQQNVGKSSIALEMCAAVAARGVVAGYCSFEDPRVLVGTRWLSMFAGISSRRIERRAISHQDWQRLAQAGQSLQDLGDRLLVSTSVGGTQLDACAVMTRMAQRGAKLVVVDYLQAISSATREQDRRNEMRKVVQALKKQAARLDMALVLLSQLNRPPKGSENREPGKHDLKETGDLEDGAENIVMVWREQENDFAPIHLKLAKGKSGGLGQRWSMQRSEESGRLRELQHSHKK